MVTPGRCENCKDTFNIKAKHQRFCCVKCRDMAARDRNPRVVGTTRKACLQCGGVGDFRRNQRFCCHACGNNHCRRGKTSYCGYGVCKRCGTMFRKRATNNAYCSSECSTKKVSASCVVCERSFLTSRGAKVCGKACSKVSARKRLGRPGWGESTRMDF